MNGSYWSPITCLIASTFGCNKYTFNIELLLYILIGGLGLNKLANYWQLNEQVNLITAIAFMRCVYQTSHMQHYNCLSGALFLLVLVGLFNTAIKTFFSKNVLMATLLFYMLIASLIFI